MAEMFLKFDPDIAGESLDAVHTNEIEVKAWNWEAINKVKWDINQGGQSTRMDISAVSIQKTVDSATHLLFQYCSNGKHITNAKLTARKNNGDDKVEYLILTMNNVMVSKMHWEGNGDEQYVAETVELSFAEFKMEYKTQDDTGAGQSKGEHGWNVQKQKAA